MTRNPGRPMAVSILHRATGAGMAVVAGLIFIWWLTAAAMGADAYATFLAVAGHPLAYVVWIGLTWSFFQHLCNGLRHFVMDVGAGYELKTNKMGALVVMAVPLLITLAIWAPILAKLTSGEAE